MENAVGFVLPVLMVAGIYYVVRRVWRRRRGLRDFEEFLRNDTIKFVPGGNKQPKRNSVLGSSL